MTTLSLREAAEQAGVSKSTVFRAIQSGRMSAPRTDDGGFAIDPAELFRVYPPKSAAERVASHSKGHDAPDSDTVALLIRNVQLEAELNGLRAMAEELRRSRDKWEEQAERLVRQLAPPVIVPPSPASTVPSVSNVRTNSGPAPRGWWPFRRTG
jgi:excisionase family DNA binding protein